MSDDHAPEPPSQDTGAPLGRPAPSPRATVLANLDVVLVAVALVPAIELGAPMLGVWLGSGGWILSRVVAVLNGRWIGKATDPMKQLMMNVFEAFGRIWLLAGVIVAASVLGEREDGLAASVIIFAAYSVAFVIKLVSGALRPRAAK